MINLSLADVFEQAFGYRSGAFDPKFGLVVGHQDNDILREEQGRYASPYYGTDAYTGLEYYLPVTLGDVVLSHPVIGISMRKTIIETPLTERRGTVKEVINIMDCEIVIKGLIIGKYNEYPEAEVTTLRNLFEANKAVSISNPITDIFLMGVATSGSDKVVIKELSFPEVKGAKNVRPYQISLIGDAPFNLIDLN